MKRKAKAKPSKKPTVTTYRIKYVAKQVEVFNAKDNPILHVRSWLDGYQHRLAEADRSRHYANANSEDYRRMLAWADDPKRDRRSEALPILLELIRTHPQPAYTPEVLLIEYHNLNLIPLAHRLAENYPSRMSAWIDRVETFLQINKVQPRWLSIRKAEIVEALGLSDKEWVKWRTNNESAIRGKATAKRIDLNLAAIGSEDARRIEMQPSAKQK